MASPTLSRRGVLGAGLRRVLATRLDDPAPVVELPRPARRHATDRSAELGGRLTPVADEMVEMAGVCEGQTVLAAAAGNHALAKAVIRRRAVVAPSESLRFDLPDATFDAVLAFFSATSHPDPRSLADELKRVARPGAAIVLATWEGQPWARYETAYRHFFGFPELDVTAHTLAESGMGYSLVFARKPFTESLPRAYVEGGSCEP